MRKPLTETPPAILQARANRMDNPLLSPLGKQKMVTKAQHYLTKLATQETAEEPVPEEDVV